MEGERMSREHGDGDAQDERERRVRNGDNLRKPDAGSVVLI
jgi:hypothetical protein